MRYFCLALCLCLPLIGHSASVYKWKDKQGNVHFSDQPHPGAERVKLPPTQTFSPPALPPEKNTSQQNAAGERSYKSISVIQPENNATIRNNQGLVSVAVSIDPSLMKGDNVVLLFDGKAVGEPQPTTAFTLNGVERGTHSIAVQVIDSKAKVIGQSNDVTIHMHRPRVGQIAR